MIDLGAINDTDNDQDLKARVFGGLPAQYQPNLNAAMSDAGSSDYPNHYRTGPTFAERIAAKPGTMQPAQPAPQAPVPAPPPIQIDASKLPPGILPSTAKVDATVPSYGSPQPPSVQLPPAKMPPGILRTTLAPSEVPSPAASSPATTVLPNLMQQRSQAAAPIDPKAIDPQTGKPMYRMGWKGRLAGLGLNFLSGAGGRGPVEYVGPGATNSRFAHDTSMQEKRVAGLDTDIGNQEKLAGLQEKGTEDALKQAYEGQVGDARAQTAQAAEDRAKAAGETADVKSQLAASQSALNQAKAAQATSTGNKNDATRPRAIMGTRTMEKQDDGSWKDVGPAPAKPAGSGRGKQSDFDKIERDKQKQIKDAEIQASTAVMKLKPPKPGDPEYSQYVINRVAWMQGKKQDIYAELEGKKAQAQADYEARIQEKGGTVSIPGQATVKTPPPNKVVPANGAGAKTNEPRVRVREKASGKVGTIPQSQLKGAVSSGKYESAQ